MRREFTRSCLAEYIRKGRQRPFYYKRDFMKVNWEEKYNEWLEHIRNDEKEDDFFILVNGCFVNCIETDCEDCCFHCISPYKRQFDE